MTDAESVSATEQEAMPALDALLAMATDEWGPHRVISMLRDKALVIETISNRRLH